MRLSLLLPLVIAEGIWCKFKGDDANACLALNGSSWMIMAGQAGTVPTDVSHVASWVLYLNICPAYSSLCYFQWPRQITSCLYPSHIASASFITCTKPRIGHCQYLFPSITVVVHFVGSNRIRTFHRSVYKKRFPSLKPPDQRWRNQPQLSTRTSYSSR